MSKKSSIENASDIIERFGGIRPMASKINVAVTTVQGWKKRGVIPGGRFDTIVSAAAQHDVDLSGVLGTVSANENEAVIEPADLSARPEQPAELKAEPSFKADIESAAAGDVPSSFIASMLHDDIVSMVIASERRAVLKSTWTTIFLIVLTIGAIAVLFWPQVDQLSDEARRAEMQRLQTIETELETLKQDMSGVKNRQGFFGKVLPENLNERLDDLQSKAEEAREGALNAVDEVKSFSSDLIEGRAGALQDRMEALENQLSALDDVPLISGLTQRYQAFAATAGGQDLLESTTGELSSLLSGLGGETSVEQAIEGARTESTALGQSFEGVAAQDLKAAALLLTMTQLRSTLNRPGDSFAGDLGLLRNLVGDDDIALAESIERLAPYADGGVLTPAGLSDELKGLTGDIVVASLKGEDVSIQDRAKARLNDLLQIEKDGDLVTGTPTQAAVTQAQNALASGDLAGAIAQMQGLDGSAAEVAAPWLNQAKGALMAQELKNTLSGVLANSASGLGGITAGVGLTPSELMVDPISGTTLLKR